MKSVLNKSLLICSHTVAADELNKELCDFTEWYSVTKLSALAMHNMPRGAEHKGGKPLRKKAPLCPRVLTDKNAIHLHSNRTNTTKVRASNSTDDEPPPLSVVQHNVSSIDTVRIPHDPTHQIIWCHHSRTILRLHCLDSRFDMLNITVMHCDDLNSDCHMHTTFGHHYTVGQHTAV